MSERKNHLTIDGGQVKEDEHISSYKPIPESDTGNEIEYIEAEGEYVQMHTSEVMDTDAGDDEDHWEHNSIATMLAAYLQNIEKIRNPKIKKKSVWTAISNEVNKSPDSCHRKFRNLKQTYIRLLKKKINNKNELVNVKWPYFDMFEEIYFENGEYNSEIQLKLQENTTDSVAKALLSLSSQQGYKSSQHSETEDLKKKIDKKRYAEFKRVSIEMRDRQKAVEEKLDKLIGIVEESNVIQRERNELFQQFLEKLHQN